MPREGQGTGMVRLEELVRTSAELAATASRNRKTEQLATLLARLAPDEAGIGVSFLSGHLRQGRIGLGPAGLNAARGIAHASESSLTLADVDRAFERIASVAGPGSGGARAALLG